MKVIDYKLICRKCGKQMGALSMAYIGVPHNTGVKACTCIECLPKSLDEAEANGYDEKIIKEFREWIAAGRTNG